MDLTKTCIVVLFFMATAGIVLGIVSLTRTRCAEAYDPTKEFIAPSDPSGTLSTESLPGYLDTYMTNYFSNQGAIDDYLTTWLANKGITFSSVTKSGENPDGNKISLSAALDVSDTITGANDLSIASDTSLNTVNGSFSVGMPNKNVLYIDDVKNGSILEMYENNVVTIGTDVKMTAKDGGNCGGNGKSGPCYLRVASKCDDCSDSLSSRYRGVYIGADDNDNTWTIKST